MNIKDSIKRHEKLYYLIYCFSKVNSERFRNRVLTIRTNPYSLVFDHYGSENADKVFYEILVGDETKGFCSAIRDTLYYLMYADAMNFVPYIHFADNIPYHEDHLVNGKSDVFEYYFEQPSDIDFDELKKSAKVVHAESVHLQGNFALHGLKQPKEYYSSEAEAIEICGEMYKKYIRLNKIVYDRLEKDMRKLFPAGCKRVLGVHYRGTDFKVGYNGHPVVIKFQHHIEEAKKLMSAEQFDYVFLATEDGDVISEFKRQFGDKLLLYPDVIRGTGETNAYNMVSDRENHHYLLGYEVLRDVYTLSRCNSFVTSMSGVGITSQIIKESYGEKYDKVIMLNAGINKNSKVLQKNKY